jgi:hypothetical protein
MIYRKSMGRDDFCDFDGQQTFLYQSNSSSTLPQI